MKKVEMQTLEPTSNTFTISYPSDGYFSEFEIQSFIYNELRSVGIDCRGEIVHTIGRVRSERNERCRFDLLIFVDHVLSEIVEVKRSHKKHKSSLEDIRQAKRYRQFGVPSTFVYGMDDAIKFVELRRG